MNETILDEMITNSGFSPYQFESEEEWLSIREGMLHFAGLVVKECVKYLKTTDFSEIVGNQNDVAATAAEDLQNLFGVE